MRRRLRKKLHRGEFTEHGFNVEWTHAPDATDDDREAVLFALVEAVERDGLLCGGGDLGLFFSFCDLCARGARRRYRPRSVIGPTWMPAHRSRGSCTEAHREAVRAFLTGDPRVAACVVGPLVDAWAPARAGGAT